jgi:hypothetical protein
MANMCPVCRYFGGAHARWCLPERRAVAAAAVEAAQTGDEVADLGAAADLIRDQHPLTDPNYPFWRELADLFGRVAARARLGQIRTSPGWSEFNGAVAAARAYVQAGGIQ